MILVIPIFVPHAGCPHDCCFCNQKIISGSKKLPGGDEIAEKIGRYAGEAGRYGEVEIAFFGGSFTAIEPDMQEHYLKAAAPFLKVNGGFVDSIRISTRPDAIDQDTVKRLKKYSVRIVELGAQSMDEKALLLSDRGHTADDTRRASELLKSSGFVLGLQTMTGLPGADEESDVRTAHEIAALRPDFVRIYPTVVVENTRLCRDFEAGLYKPMTTDDAVRLCSKLCEIYAANGISVARIGLQSTDSITRSGSESEVRGGPYHEAFGQLVRSYDALEAMTDAIRSLDSGESGGSGFGTLTAVTSRTYFSDVLGQKRANAERLKAEFGFNEVNVSPEDAPCGNVFRKRAGRVIFRKTVDIDSERYTNRLAKVTRAELCRREEPTGKDSFREVTDASLWIEFKSLRQ